MNVFWLAGDPRLAAMYHDDNRVIKMCTEAAQALGTGLRIRAQDPLSPLTPRICDEHEVYADYNRDNALPHWVAESRTHMYAVYEVCRHLSAEYEQRWESDEAHGAFETAQKWWSLMASVPDHGWRDPPFYGDDEYWTGDLVESYRRYYAFEKGDSATYARTAVPDWWPDDAPQPEVSG